MADNDRGRSGEKAASNVANDTDTVKVADGRLRKPKTCNLCGTTFTPGSEPTGLWRPVPTAGSGTGAEP